MIALIGGSGLSGIDELLVHKTEIVTTPYGDTSAALNIGQLFQKDIVFLPRHGTEHSIPPHKINYRANIWSLKEIGVTEIISVAAVGSITGLPNCGLMIPDQVIDYTYGREHTFFNGNDGNVEHVDFTAPYCEELRSKLVQASTGLRIEIRTRGTYGATQGPRFETAAEINRMERDGADIVGMTGMPEAALARELDLCYATIAVAVNPAAGKSTGKISLAEIEANLATGISNVKQVLRNLLMG